jgi:hypothetical protein
MGVPHQTVLANAKGIEVVHKPMIMSSIRASTNVNMDATGCNATMRRYMMRESHAKHRKRKGLYVRVTRIMQLSIKNRRLDDSDTEDMAEHLQHLQHKIPRV